MQYNLNDPLDRERFKAKANALYKKGGIVELTDKRQRSLSQNAYLHVILGCFALEVGESVEYVKQEVFKRICNPDIFVVNKEIPILGKISTLRSSKDVTVAEMATAIDRYRKWCSEQGVYIPEANEDAIIASLQAQLAKYQHYL